MRLPLLIAALVLAGSAGGPASAQSFEGQSFIGGRLNGPEGPWCAHQDTGDRILEDCSFSSFEACNQEALRNRGFCTRNFAGGVVPVRTRKGSRDRSQ